MQTQQHINKQKTLAFTVIELVIVIVVIGIISVATLPRLFKTQSFETSSFFNQALNMLRYAQKISISMGCEVQVSHTSNTISLKLRDSCTTGSFNTNVDDPGNTGNPYTKTAPTGVTITSNGFPIYFDRAGRANNSGGAIANTTMQINSKIITIIGESGYAYAQ